MYGSPTCNGSSRRSGFVCSASAPATTFTAAAGLREQVNLQEVSGKAKPYQIRQFLKLVERYNLTIEDN